MAYRDRPPVAEVLLDALPPVRMALRFYDAPAYDEPADTLRANVLSRVLLLNTLAAVVILVVFVPAALNTPNLALTLVGGVAALLAGVGLQVLVRSGQVQRAATLLVTAYVLMGIALYVLANGIRGTATMVLLFTILLAALTLPRMYVYITAGVSTLVLFGLFFLDFYLGVLNPVMIEPGLQDWAGAVLVFALAAAALRTRAEDTVNLVRDNVFLNRRLDEVQAGVEQRVLERTGRLRTSIEMSTILGQIREPAELIREVVDLVSERFGYFYVALFVIDDAGQWAELRAATGTAGQALVDRGHRLQVGGNSMVGAASSTGEPRVANDVAQEARRFENPFLTSTRSEMAVPVMAGKQVLGVLDVQSVQVNAFSNEDIQTLQALANQVGIALSNARLLREAEARIEEVRRLQAVYLQEAWSETAREVPADSLRLHPDGEVRPGRTLMPGLNRALRTRRLEVTENRNQTAITSPIMLRDQIVGALNIKAEGRAWSDDELAVIEAITTQTALALENARLIQETQSALTQAQRLADRERQVNDIANRIRQDYNVESILKTTLDEIRQAIGIDQAVVHLGVPQALRQERGQRNGQTGELPAPPPDPRTTEADD